jgi:hypothetical protein
MAPAAQPCLAAAIPTAVSAHRGSPPQTRLPRRTRGPRRSPGPPWRADASHTACLSAPCFPVSRRNDDYRVEPPSSVFPRRRSPDPCPPHLPVSPSSLWLAHSERAPGPGSPTAPRPYVRSGLGLAYPAYRSARALSPVRRRPPIGSLQNRPETALTAPWALIPPLPAAP